MKAAVLVLGDVGRSPRMQYHTASLSNDENFETVYLVGYKGSTCFEGITRKANVEMILMSPFSTKNISRSLFLVYAPFKIMYQFYILMYTLFISLPSCEYILVQNPPCIPTFFAVLLLSFVKRTRVIIDWHNLGYSILQTNFENVLEPNEKLTWVQEMVIAIAKRYELYLGSFAYKHFTVTAAMKDFLVENTSIDDRDIVIVYDKAPNHFKPLSVSQKHKLFYKLENLLFSNGFDLKRYPLDILETPFTVATVITPEKKADSEIHQNQPPSETGENVHPSNLLSKTFDENAKCYIKLKKAIQERPFLIVSSTSYTPDEDFSILLEALYKVDKALIKMAKEKQIQQVTGKGPLKEHYHKKIKELDLFHVVINQVWLEIEDYPLLLGSADLGVSLHTSSSGLDLPMKVVDMFGAGLPVCAVDFKCLPELVQNGKNGLVFKNPSELSQQIMRFVKEEIEVKFNESREATKQKLIKRLKDNVLKERSHDWDEEWREKAKEEFAVFNVAQMMKPLRVILALIIAVCYAIITNRERQ